MIKLKLSYETDEELEQITKFLEPIITKVHRSKNESGKFRKAYFVIEPRMNRENVWKND